MEATCETSGCHVPFALGRPGLAWRCLRGEVRRLGPKIRGAPVSSREEVRLIWYYFSTKKPNHFLPCATTCKQSGKLPGYEEDRELC